MLDYTCISTLFLGFNALYTVSHLLNEIELKKKQVKMKNDNIETTSIKDTMRRWKTNK
jgi:hypothetical protein